MYVAVNPGTAISCLLAEVPSPDGLGCSAVGFCRYVISVASIHFQAGLKSKFNTYRIQASKTRPCVPKQQSPCNLKDL